jgi:glycerol-3-phosphate O-acyltransferase
LLRQGTIPPEESVLNYGPLKEAMARFVSTDKVERVDTEDGAVFEVDSSRRMTLEYYKNGIVHWFVPASLLATAIQAHGEQSFEPRYLTRDLRFLLFVLRYEFALDPSLDEDIVEALALEHLEAAGVVQSGIEGAEASGAWSVVDNERLVAFSGITRNFIESQLLVLEGLKEHQDRNLDRKALAKEIQKYGQKKLGSSTLQRTESLNLITLQNAIKGFEEDGTFLGSEEEGRVLYENGWLEYRDAFTRLLGCGDE